MSPRLSIIVPSLSGRIDAVQSSLASQTYCDWELIPVVGVSPAGRARNIGVARSTGGLLLFIDDDAVLGHPEVLSRMVSALEGSGASVVGAARVLPPGATALQRRIALEVPRWVSRIPEQVETADPPTDRYGFSAVTTTCCLIERSAFESVGGFDESLVTGEDPELFVRLARAGHRFVMAPAAWTFHAPPRRFRTFLRKCFYYGVGHAQEARDPSRGMALFPVERPSGKILLLFGPFLVGPLMLVDLRLEPRIRAVPAFRPIQSIARAVTVAGYLWGRSRAS